MKKNLHPHENLDAHITSSVTTKKMMSEQVEPDAFEPPCHKLKPNIKAKLEALLKEYTRRNFHQHNTSNKNEHIYWKH